MNVRPFCIALLGLSLAAATPAAALDASDLMGSWYASGLTATTAEQDPTILELFLTVNIDGTIDLSNEETGENDQSYAVSYDKCFHPRTDSSDAAESDEEDPADAEIFLQVLVTGGDLQVDSDGVVTGTVELDSDAEELLGYDTIVIDDFRMNSSAELITGVTNLTGDRVMHMNMIRLPVDEDAVTVPCLFDNCDVMPAPTATLTGLTVALGDSVAQGDALATVVGDITETITAPAEGMIGQVNYEVGATVEFGQTLLVIESPATTVSEIETGQPKSQFAEGSWRIVGYFETIQDGGQDFPYIIPSPTGGAPSWDIVQLNVGIGTAVTQGETVALLVPTGGTGDFAVEAPSSGVVTEVYQATSEIVLPDLGGSEDVVVSTDVLPGFPQKILCLGQENAFFPGRCVEQLERGDFVSEGAVLATIQPSPFPNSTKSQILAPGDGFITELNVSPCLPLGSASPPATCTDEIATGSALMSTAPEATLVDLLVTTNSEISIGQVVAKAEDEASGSSPVDILSTANGRVTEIFLDQWTQGIAYGTPLMVVNNFQPAGEEVTEGETLLVVNEDPTCHPDFNTTYSFRAASMGVCDNATITSVNVSAGEAVCERNKNSIAYEYECPNPDDTSGPPVTGEKNDFEVITDSVVVSVVSLGQTVSPGDTLMTLRRGYNTNSGSINGDVRVYAGNEGLPGGLSNPHTGQLQTSSVEFTDSCELTMATVATSKPPRVSRALKGQPSGEFNFAPDPGGDWYFQISRDRNFAIGNSVGFYLGGNFRHQNLLMVKGPEDAIHVPSLGLGNPDVDLTDLHGLTPTDRAIFPPAPGSTVSLGDPLATLLYTPPSAPPVQQIVRSPIDGYVDEIFFPEGTTDIAYDQTLMTLRSSPTYPTPTNQPAETVWKIRGFTDEAGLLAGATRTGTLTVNEDGDQLTGGDFQSSDGNPPQTVTGGAVELVVYESVFSDLSTWQPETTTGEVLFGTQGDPMTFSSGPNEKENLMLSLQRDVIAGVTEDTNGVTGFMVGMVPEPSARLLALAALGALGAIRWRLRGRA